MSAGYDPFSPPTRRPRRGGSVTGLLVGICCVVFFLQIWLGAAPGTSGYTFEETFFLQRYTFVTGALWQPLTHIFLHGNLTHLIVNMLGLATAGPWVERNLGKRHFIAIFLLGGIVGGLAQMLSSPAPLVGASGGLFAIMLALCVWNSEERIGILLFFILPVRARGKTLGFCLIATSILLMVFPVIPQMQNVAHLAHLGGAFVGVVYAWILREMMGLGPRGLHSRRPEFTPTGTWTQSPYVGTLPSREAPYPRDADSPVGYGSVPLGPVRVVRRPSRGQDPAFEALLDKLEQNGLDSLTPAERRALERGIKGSN